jgi:ubiquinone/menaquinone biosynthesis C-methylase UbiE
MSMTVTDSAKGMARTNWSAGDYSVIGSRFLIASELLCEASDLRGGQKVLDVATGTGNTALAAARRSCDVIGVDIIPIMLERARLRAQAEGLTAEFREGDAETLAFPDGSFDAVLSTFGCMFAPDQARTAAEMARVLRRGGTIAMANWTPEGNFTEFGRILAAFMPPPPPGLVPSILWGTESHLAKLFPGFAPVRAKRRTLMFRYRSPDHYLDLLRRTFPPILALYQSLEPARQEELTKALRAKTIEANTAKDGSLRMPMEYLEFVAIKT